MKAVILAGGMGTRISEESHLRPKPMIEIGGKPILWHIMKIYSSHGVNDFVICLGYRGYMIKEYFANYFLHMSDVTLDLAGNREARFREQLGKNAPASLVVLEYVGNYDHWNAERTRVRRCRASRDEPRATSERPERTPKRSSCR